VSYLFVDGKKYDWPRDSITGDELRALVPGFNPQFVLMQEGPDGADVLVADSVTFGLGEQPHFYTVPPATFGSSPSPWAA
jgi:hypothetical protein